MPILCITNDFGPRAGGIETFVHGLIERFPFGSLVVYTSQQGDTKLYDAMWREKHGVEVIRDRSKMLLPTPRVARAVGALVIERQISQVWFGAAAPLGLLARGLRKKGVKKMVALTHGHEVWWAQLPVFSRAIRVIGNEVDHLTYLGEFTKKKIARALTKEAAAAMIKVAPGIDVDHFMPVDGAAIREKYGLADKKVIVSVGRLVPRKGQDVLINALPAIVAKIPNVHLLLVGKGDYEKKLRRLVTKRKMENYVTFTGRIEYHDLPRYICAGDVFVMPSRSRLGGLEVEGLGIVYLEASACGLPVVAGDSGGAPDAVKEAITGFVVNGKSSEEVAAATIEILQNEALAHSMSAAGRRWIVEEWRWQIWSTQFNSLFQ